MGGEGKERDIQTGKSLEKEGSAGKDEGLAGFSPEEVRFLSQRAVQRELSGGEAVFVQGEEIRAMFLLETGRVKLSKVLEDGSEILLDIRGPGDFIGEYLFSEREPVYPASAWCMQRARFSEFTPQLFEEIVREQPNIGLHIIKRLGQQIGSLTRRVSSMSIPRLEDRLYQVLADLAREHGVRSEQGYSIPFSITHEELSFLVGAHRVSITKALRALKDSGYILQKGRIMIFPELSA